MSEWSEACLIVVPLRDLQPLNVSELDVGYGLWGVEDVCGRRRGALSSGRGRAGAQSWRQGCRSPVGGAGGQAPVRVARMAMPASRDPAYVTSAFVLNRDVCIAARRGQTAPAGAKAVFCQCATPRPASSRLSTPC